MLVLSRRVGESVVIGNDVVVTVLEVRGDIIRIGVEAPREVPVHRSEVFEAIEAANKAAAAPDDAAVSALTAAVAARAATPPPAQ